jgi:hypothetical protein
MGIRSVHQILACYREDYRMKQPKWKIEGWHDAGNNQCVCPYCGRILGTNSLGRDAHKKSCWAEHTIRLGEGRILEIIVDNKRARPSIDVVADQPDPVQTWEGYLIFSEISVLDRKQNGDMNVRNGFAVLTPDGREIPEYGGVFASKKVALNAAKSDHNERQGDQT